MRPDGLLDAAACLDALSRGETPNHAYVISGALALSTLAARGGVSRDILDAAAGLAIERGWLWLHESGTYVKFTDGGAALFT
jgi:hypothetical protein